MVNENGAEIAIARPLARFSDSDFLPTMKNKLQELLKNEPLESNTVLDQVIPHINVQFGVI